MLRFLRHDRWWSSLLGQNVGKDLRRTLPGVKDSDDFVVTVVLDREPFSVANLEFGREVVG